MKLIYAGAISTALVIFLGVTMVAPYFMRTTHIGQQRNVGIVLSVAGEANATAWCTDVASYLKGSGIKATVFFTGRVASAHPDAVSVFGEGVDVGSMTYSGVPLTSFSDYTIQLEEVQKGKQAVDSSGGFTSKLFKAPMGLVNEDIYSLLYRSGIVVDFSYNDHYNKVYEGQFIRMELKVFSGLGSKPEDILSINELDEPIIVNFNNSVPSSFVFSYIEALRIGGCRFLSASEISGLDLTLRGG